MIQIKDQPFALKFYFNETTNDALGVEDFLALIIEEDPKRFLYTGDLVISSDAANVLNLDTGEKLRVDFVPNQDDQQNSTAFSIKFIVGGSTMDRGGSRIHLYGGISDKVLKNNICKGYEGKVEDVMSEVCATLGITTTDIGTTVPASRKFLQANQNYKSFMTYLTAYASTGPGKSDFLAVIDKSNKFSLKSMAEILDNLPSQGQLTTITNFLSAYRFDVNKYFMGMQGGYGMRGAHFDWDSGDMVVAPYTMTNLDGKKFGIRREFVDDDNPILMQSPVGQDIHPPQTYNDAVLENYVIRKNAMNIGVTFVTSGITSLAPLQTIRLVHPPIGDFADKWMTNDYVIWGTKHQFYPDSYVVEITAFGRSYRRPTSTHIY